jgi:hypothetical protein
MAALRDLVQSTYGTDTQGRIPLRASRSQAQKLAVHQQESTPLPFDTSSPQSPVRTQTSAPLSSTTTGGLVEGDLPQTNSARRVGNRFKRLTGKLYPYTYRPQSGQTEARRNRWVALLRWFLSGGRFAVISKIVTLLVLLYTLAFFVASASIRVYNTWSYGPTHTSYLTTTRNGTACTIQTSNQDGVIYVMITKGDGSSQTFPGPNLKLNPDAWNGDISDVVATAEVGSNQKITIHLRGTVNYFRLLHRPEASFSLIPDGQGSYKVVQP